MARCWSTLACPKGVVNIVCGSSASKIVGPLLKDPRTRKLSFTGSTEVGRELIKQAAEQGLNVSMELGGNAPFIVHEDADLDAAVEGAILAKMRNNGEACTAANRFHAHESIAAKFGEKLAARLGAMKVGRGTEPDSQVGPLINESQREIVEGLVADAAGKGGKVLTGGERLDGPGFYYPPTVIGDLTADAGDPHRRGLRPRRPDPVFLDRGRGDRRRQRHRVRTRGLRLHPGSLHAHSARSRRSRPAWSASTAA